MTERLLAALAELERVWEQRDIPIRHHLQPGLTDAEMARVMAPTGLTLPEEARAWWRWHNGVPDGTPDYASGPGPLVTLCSLSEAVRFYTMKRTSYADHPELIDPWLPEWFVLCHGVAPKIITVDCSPNITGQTPVRVIDYWDDELDKPKASSIADMVTIWLRAWESGAYTYDPANRTWARHWERMPSDVDLSRLA